MKQLQNEKDKFNTFMLRGIFIAVITYLSSQSIFSIFLTESFNPTNSKNAFQYNLLYRISENQWWNALLIMTSLTLSVVVYISLVSYKKHLSIMKNAIYKVFLICILCNVFMLCITHPKVYAQQNVKVTLDKYIEKFIKEQNIPGAAVAIVHNKSILHKTIGVTGESEKR